MVLFSCAPFPKENPGRANCRVAAALSGSGSTAGSRLILQGDGWVSLAGSSLILLPSICIHFVLALKPLARAANTNTSMLLPLSFSFHVGLRITPENPKAHNEPSNYQRPRAGGDRCGEQITGRGAAASLDLPSGAGGPFQCPESRSESRTPSHFCPGPADFCTAKRWGTLEVSLLIYLG